MTAEPLSDAEIREWKALCERAKTEPWEWCQKDLEFIAAARTALPRALAEVERLRKSLEVLDEENATMIAEAVDVETQKIRRAELEQLRAENAGLKAHLAAEQAHRERMLRDGIGPGDWEG
jgi:hypothetical protein